MFNLKNSLFTIIALATGTMTLAYEFFNPKLIIKNISNETLTLHASDNLITQLKLENSPLLHMAGHYLKPQEVPSVEPVNMIVLNPNESLISNSVNICLRNNDTQLLSPRTYAEYRRNDEIKSIFDSITKDIKPIVTREVKQQAENSEKDIMICVAPMLMEIYPPIPYLAIIKTELVDRA